MIPTSGGRWTRRALVAAAALSIGGTLVTLVRDPTSWADGLLYASIARSLQLHDIGVPSMVRFSPVAVDHLPFYGPVFFASAAASFDLLGVSMWSFRLVTFAGALLCCTAAALLASELSDRPHRRLWAATLILLTPEVGLHSSTGSMDLMAVAFEIFALAMFVRGLQRPGHPIRHGLLTGLLLSLATLTTPRTYPFAGALLAAGALAAVPRARRRDVCVLLGATVAALAAIMCIWATATLGSPVTWARYMAFIASHENTDVALLASADRSLTLALSASITPAFAIAGSLAAAMAAGRARLVPLDEDAAVVVALVTGWITMVAIACLMTQTMTLTTYLALPLFAVVTALPDRWRHPAGSRVTRRAFALAIVALLACDGTVKIIRAVRVAATWPARDPARLAAFVGRHITPGAEVVGPVEYYFLIVESLGAHYRSYSPRSWADWARWVPRFDRRAIVRSVRTAPPSGRFLIWPDNIRMPQSYACALPQAIAVYNPPPRRLDWMGWLSRSAHPGYPRTVLYELPPSCPPGYDPTGTRGDRAAPPS